MWLIQSLIDLSQIDLLVEAVAFLSCGNGSVDPVILMLGGI